MKIKMNSVDRIVKDKGLARDGVLQRFHTHNVNRRIGRYMPHVSGTLETKLKMVVNDTDIEVLGPYAKFLYYGKVMVGIRSGSPWARQDEPKKVVNQYLRYDPTYNPKAGPFWDRALSTAEGGAIRADLQRFIDSRRGRP